MDIFLQSKFFQIKSNLQCLLDDLLHLDSEHRQLGHVQLRAGVHPPAAGPGPGVGPHGDGQPRPREVLAHAAQVNRPGACQRRRRQRFELLGCIREYYYGGWDPMGH